MSSLFTNYFGVQNAKNFEQFLTYPFGNLYLTFGRNAPWPTTNGITDNPPDAKDTNTTFYDYWDNMIGMKKITAADINPVIPRVDWTSGTVYTEYSNNTELFKKTIESQAFNMFAVDDGDTSINYIGYPVQNLTTSSTLNPNSFNGYTVSLCADQNKYTGIVPTSNFVFSLQGFKSDPGIDYIDSIIIGTKVFTEFTYTYSASSGTATWKGLTGAGFVDGGTYTVTVNKIVINRSKIVYDYQFYVRNNQDQVFKCLYNNKGNPSTISPEITIGGQLPENPYIEMGDGYKWKYMYTIPAGLKQKFFTSQFMPVVSESIVTNNSVDGRLDIIEVGTAGTGYNQNTSSSSLPVATVIGNGTGANVSLVVAAGTNGASVTGVNILDGGSGYTYATIQINDPYHTTGTAATLSTIIGPPGGHGSDVFRELGASNLMISVNLDGSESGALPLDSTEFHKFRQIGLIMNPELVLGGSASNAVYRTTTKYILTNISGDFLDDETVYDNNNSFSGVIEKYDPTNRTVYLTDVVNPTGATNLSFSGGTSHATGSVIFTEQPLVKRYSGKLLYIENSTYMVRSVDETKQFKFTLRF